MYCITCRNKDSTNMSKCSKCKTAKYCSKRCQLMDWSEHKKWCAPNGHIAEKLCFLLWDYLEIVEIGNACLATSLLISDALWKREIENRVVDGYVVRGPYYLRHVWVELEEPTRRVEVSISKSAKRILETSLQVRQVASVLKQATQYVKEEPRHLERIDQDTYEEKKTLEELEEGIRFYNQFSARKDDPEENKKRGREMTLNKIIRHNRVWGRIERNFMEIVER